MEEEADPGRGAAGKGIEGLDVAPVAHALQVG